MKRYVVELPAWGLVIIISILFTSAWLGYLIEPHVWFMGLALFLAAVWFGYAATTTVHCGIGGGLSCSFPWNEDGTGYNWRGESALFSSSSRAPFYVPYYVVLPSTILGCLSFWWPVIASVGVGLLTLMASLMPTSRPLLRKRHRIPRPRLTLFRMMVVIGTVSAWLWLGRFQAWIRAGGTLTFGLMLHAGFRGAFLVSHATAEGAQATRLSRAGVALYAVVLLVGVAWVVTILVWDSYQELP